MNSTAVQPPPPAPASASENRLTALVLGGGLAGIAAALDLAESDYRVTLVEARKRLGGRASSSVLPSGRLLDNCQHVVMGCCTALIDLYRRLDVLHLIDWHDEVRFIDRHGAHDVLRPSFLPAPLHLAASALTFRSISATAKLAIARAMAALIKIPPASRQAFASITFADWLRQHRQPADAITRFWTPVIVSALNGPPEDVAASYAIQVFQEGFLANRAAQRIGIPRVPLLDLYEPARRLIARHGGEVMTGVGVEQLLFEDGRIVGAELLNGNRLSADAYVSALPHARLAEVAPEALLQADPRIARASHLRPSPILGVHLWYDRRVTDLPHFVLFDSPLQWVFNKGVDAAGRHHLHAVVSAADEWMSVPPERIVTRAEEELSTHLPAARSAIVVEARAMKERRATFRPAPGSDAFRPAAAGPVPNLFLAGDWCRTGWPATMEGAVRSGRLAAAAITGRDTATTACMTHLPVASPLRALWATRPNAPIESHGLSRGFPNPQEQESHA